MMEQSLKKDDKQTIMKQIDPSKDMEGKDLIDGWMELSCGEQVDESPTSINCGEYDEVEVNISLAEELKDGDERYHSFMAISNEPKFNASSTVYNTLIKRQEGKKEKLGVKFKVKKGSPVYI